MKLFYDIFYRYFHVPWDIGPRDELVRLVENRSVQPGRAIDLGCGAGANAIFLSGEITERFGKYFDIAKIAGKVNWSS